MSVQSGGQAIESGGRTIQPGIQPLKSGLETIHTELDNLQNEWRVCREMIQNGQFGGTFGALSEKLCGKNLYLSYLRHAVREGFLTKEVNGVELGLNPRDQGISSRLLNFGKHEEHSTAVYRSELQSLEDHVHGDVTVLEIGANIGYYALQAADILGDRAKVLAFEPDPRNREALKHGIESNGFDDAFEVYPYAVGDRQGEVEMHLSTHSNWNMVSDPPEHMEEYFEEDRSIEVPMTTVDDFLTNNDGTYGDIDVIRMDVEGYEYEVFNGMDQLLDSGSPRLVFIEVHPQIIGAQKAIDVISRLESSGLEITTIRNPNGEELNTYADLYDYCSMDPGIHGIELLVAN